MKITLTGAKAEGNRCYEPKRTKAAAGKEKAGEGAAAH